MASTPERFRQVALKLTRARQHQAALEAELHRYLSRNPYKVGIRIDSSRRPVYFVTSVTAVPDSVALIAGDAIQNLVSALDHLAYQLVCSATSDSPPKPRSIYFPIAEDLEKYESKKRSKLQGASADAFSAIDALRPYRGGDDVLWELQELNNIEKHRLLLAIGAQAAGIGLGQLLAMHNAGVFSTDDIATFESMNHFLMPANAGYPLQPGFRLYVGGPGEMPNPNLQFRFSVVFNEQGVVDGRPVLDVVAAFVNRVEEIANRLRPHLR